MAKWYDQPEFLKLRKSWYQKLKNEGFKELELINWHTGESVTPSMMVKLNSRTNLEHTEEYYQGARRQLEDLELEFRVWAIHCEGGSDRRMAKELGISRYRAAKVLRGLQDRMAQEKAAEVLSMGAKPYKDRYLPVQIEFSDGTRAWYSEDDWLAYSLAQFFGGILEKGVTKTTRVYRLNVEQERELADFHKAVKKHAEEAIEENAQEA